MPSFLKSELDADESKILAIPTIGFLIFGTTSRNACLQSRFNLFLSTASFATFLDTEHDRRETESGLVFQENKICLVRIVFFRPIFSISFLEARFLEESIY